MMIDQVDLSPIILNEIILPTDRTLRFKKPLELPVRPCKNSEQYFCVEHKELHIHCYALNRKLLLDAINKQIAFLWDEYANADDNTLDSESLTLKKALLVALEEVL